MTTPDKMIPVIFSSLENELPDTPRSYEVLVSHTDSLMRLARNNYTGELKHAIHYFFQELDVLSLDETSRMSIKTILTDIQSILLYDGSEYYLELVSTKLRTLKYFITPN